MGGSILLIDRDEEALRTTGEYLRSAGFEVVREFNAAEALATYDRLGPDLVVLDIQLPENDDGPVLDSLLGRGASVILLADADQAAAAVAAVKAGAENFLSRPPALEHLAAVCARVAEKTRLRRMARGLLLPETGNRLESLGVSQEARDLAQQVTLLAQSDRTTVLLQGEVGVGKAWTARLIHRLSSRGHQPFLQVGCGAKAQDLDRALFGNEPATSDGDDRHRGAIELAEGGTLLLEDIGSLPAELQPKLLKVLETKTFRRVGGSHDLACDVRIIAATNGDLQSAVDDGELREDLYYRLSVMPLRLRPVREFPKDDLLELVRATLEELGSRIPEAPRSIAPEALERMVSYRWPGNILEVRNVMERCAIMARGENDITVQHLPGEMRARYGLGDRRHTPQTLEELERQHIERTLRHHEGNRTRASQELGISRATLINKIKRYDIKL